MSVVAAFVLPHPPILLPEVGLGEEKKLQKTADAYREAIRRAAAYAPDVVVIASPHAAMYADYFHISPGHDARGDMSRFRARSVRAYAAYDTAFVQALCALAQREGLPAGTQGERDPALDHGTLIPLLFYQELDTKTKLVRMGLSGLSPAQHYQMGKCVAQTAEALAKRVVFIASGDLSHRLSVDGPYGYAPEGPRFDAAVTEALGEGDFASLLSMPPELAEAAGECGLRSLWVMAGALDGKSVTPELLSYQGPFGVGYGIAAFAVTGEDPARCFDKIYLEREQARLTAVKAQEDPYVRLARLSVETYVRTGKPAAAPEDLPADMLATRAGVFVSLKKHGQLRGCIGTISPVTGSVAEEILRNGIAAAAEDPRFDPVAPEELNELTYSVDVLGEAESIDSPAALDPQRYGVIVQKGGRRGLLLPALDGVDTAAEQIAIAKRKAGIDEREDAKLYRFEVVRHL